MGRVCLSKLLHKRRKSYIKEHEVLEQDYTNPLLISCLQQQISKKENFNAKFSSYKHTHMITHRYIWRTTPTPPVGVSTTPQ